MPLPAGAFRFLALRLKTSGSPSDEAKELHGANGAIGGIDSGTVKTAFNATTATVVFMKMQFEERGCSYE